MKRYAQRRKCDRTGRDANNEVARDVRALLGHDEPDPGPVDATPSEVQILREALANEAFLAMGDQLQKPRTPNSPGAPEKYPAVVALLFALFVHKLDSKSAAERFMRENWSYIRRSLRKRYPQYHAFKTNKGWMRRQRYDDYKRRHELHGDRLDQAFEEWAAETAQANGIGQRSKKSSVTNPARNNIGRGDGTVLGSRYKHLKGQKGKRRNGDEYIPRSDPDAAVHETGTGRQIGTKWVVISGHTGDPNGIMVFSIRQQKPGDGGEMAVGVKAVEDVTRRIEGLQAITWDKAVRGKHIAAFLKLGLLPIIKVHGRKTKKPMYIETISVTLDDGTECKIRLYALPDGGAAIKVVNQGKEMLVPLSTKQARLRKLTDGASWFIEAVIPDRPEVPEELRNVIAWWRPQDSTDAERSHRLGEHLRIHGEDTDYFQSSGGYWTRNTAETINGWLKEDLHQGRARSVTQDAQHLDIIGAGIYRNLQTTYMARRRAADPPTPALAA